MVDTHDDLNGVLAGKKRTSSRPGEATSENPQNKRVNHNAGSQLGESKFTLAHQLITNIHSLEPTLQNKILEIIDVNLRGDPELMRSALKQQVSSNRLLARDLYEKRDIGGLLSLLSSVTSESAILLHLEIALVHNSIIEASATLSRTLIPIINQVNNFNFITPDSHFIFNRFLSAMLLHHKDTLEPLGAGLILLALVLNPLSLRGIFG
jgi:hypothetical protein